MAPKTFTFQMAAQNCRKRKLGQIDELGERLQAARRTQDMIRQEHSKYVSVSVPTMIKKITIVSTRLLSEYSNEEQKLRELSEKVLHFFLFFFFTFFFLFFFLLLTFILKGASLREERSNTVDCSGRFDYDL